MYSERQKQLDAAIVLNDLDLVRKMAKKILKDAEFNQFTIKSRANQL